MRSYLRELFLRKGIYLSIRYSSLFRLYLYFFKRRVLAEEQKEVRFYRSFLSPCELIFDIGAHDGHKTAAFLKIAQNVVCCEPDVKNQSILKARFRKSPKRVRVVSLAVSSEEGIADFHIHNAGSAFNTLNMKWRDSLIESGRERFQESFETFSKTCVSVNTTTLDKLMERFGTPYFVKIDVEGNELKAIQGLTSRVSYLSFESNLPEFRDETLACLSRLNDLDPSILLNYSTHEKLELPTFLPYQEFLGMFETLKAPCVEIICKMNP